VSQRNLRIVVFSPSVVSTRDNPGANRVREMCQALIALGCDVTHLEERGNAWYRAMLEAEGAEPLRAFNRDFPLIRYRFYDIPQGIHRSVWFGRELATADLVIVYPDSPEGVVEEVAGFAVPQVVRLWDAPETNIPDLREPVFSESDQTAETIAHQLIQAVNNELIRRRQTS
jgi:hypothetical protein